MGYLKFPQTSADNGMRGAFMRVSIARCHGNGGQAEPRQTESAVGMLCPFISSRHIEVLWERTALRVLLAKGEGVENLPEIPVKMEDTAPDER